MGSDKGASAVIRAGEAAGSVLIPERMSDDRPPRKTYSEAMNEWASQEGRASFSERSRVSSFMPDPFAHPVARLLGYVWRLGLVGLLGFGTYWFLLRSHLGSKEFAVQFASKIKVLLGAETALISRLSWQGDLASARQFSATGGPGAIFRSLEAEDVSFRVPFAMLWKKEWNLRLLEASALKVELRSGGLGTTAASPAIEGDELESALDSFDPPVVSAPGENLEIDAATPDPGTDPVTQPRDKRLLDLKLMKDGFSVAPDLQGLRLGGVEASHFTAGWGMSAATRGELRDGALSARRAEDGAWLIEIASGLLSQNWLRDLKVTDLRARLADGVLSVDDTRVMLGQAVGVLGGRVRCADVPVFELALQIEKIPLEKFCGDPFDRLFSLQGSGELRIGGSTNLATGVTVEGALNVDGGFIHGLAIQHALANTTGRIRFREFEITGGTIEFATGAGRVEVKSFALASRADVMLRGSFTHAEEKFSGSLQIGVDPALLQKLAPSVLAEYFPKEEEGKRWLTTPLEGGAERLTSLVSHGLSAAHDAAGPADQ